MPHCLNCEAEFVEGITICSDCGQPLLPGPLPEIKEKPPTETKWVLLQECVSDLEAELLKQLLEDQHIAVWRRGTFRGSFGISGGTTPWAGERITLFVPENKIGIASRILRERHYAGKFGNSPKQLDLARKTQAVRMRRKRRMRK